MTETGALVVGGDYQGLGIVRSLGRQGIPTCVLDDEPSIARYSRYASMAVRVSDLRDETAIVEAALSAAERLDLEGWVVYPTRDEVVTAFSRARDRLGKVFRMPTPGWETVRYAIDKRLTNALAERVGVSTPRTWYPETVEALDDMVSDTWPLLVKPAIKQHFIYTTRVKGWVVHDRDELRARFIDALAVVGPGEVMVQDMIPGNGRSQYAYCAFFKDGRAVGRMVVCRRRQRPADIGRSSTYVVTVDDPELVETSERFLRELDYYGLVELEYKLDERDGMYKLLDVNARTWGYHSVGHTAGVDFPLLLFRDQLGFEVPTVEARPGVSWVRVLTDTPTALAEVVRRRLGLREYVRSLRSIATEAAFSREDPRPGWAEVALLPYLIRTRAAIGRH
jgi:predicted ATP-grasp superfamily ATP-dependent carboligase